MFKGCCLAAGTNSSIIHSTSLLLKGLLHALTELKTAAVIASDQATPTLPSDIVPNRALSPSPAEVKGRSDAGKHAETVPRAQPGDGETIPEKKMDADSQSEGGGGRIMRSERARVIDWIHHQIAILGF